MLEISESAHTMTSKQDWFKTDMKSEDKFQSLCPNLSCCSLYLEVHKISREIVGVLMIIQCFNI